MPPHSQADSPAAVSADVTASAAPIRVLAGLRITSACTLLSRVLGMVRDVATASLFGLGSGGVMDAFAVAFRIPNAFRRLFGEGALSAAFLPVFASRLEREGPRAAWQLASALAVLLTAVLLVLVVLGEGVCWLAWRRWGDEGSVRLLLGLTAVMLPYVIFICVAAQLMAMLHALGHFTMPALAPVVLNVMWITAVCAVAPTVTSVAARQAYVLAWFVLSSGALQLAVLVPGLVRRGFRLEWAWARTRGDLVVIGRSMLPVALGLGIVQLNTLADSFIAWGLTRPEQGPAVFDLLGRSISYPLEAGAAASIYFGERLYQFPLGIFGVALGTVLYPLLARHAAQENWDGIRRDVSMAMRLVLVIGLPASVGLVIVARPLTDLLFLRGAFTEHDAIRTARMIACFGSGVWAYCALQILVRGFYAIGDRTTPVKIGAGMVGLNLALNLTLVWWIAEAGLGISTSVCAALQSGLMLWLLASRIEGLDWSGMGRVAWRSAAATGMMALVCVGAIAVGPAGESTAIRAARVALPVLSGTLAYWVSCRFLGVDELRWILGGRDQ